MTRALLTLGFVALIAPALSEPALAAPASPADEGGMGAMDPHDRAGRGSMSEMGPMAGMDSMADMKSMPMKGLYGQYPMSREASGTAWLPESTPMEGLPASFGEWSAMFHGYADLVYDNQGGARGADKTYVEGMAMGMGSRPLGPGTLGMRLMMSPDPLIGKNGYPELLQTGETANGTTPLIDRQHPHDLIMELATSYSQRINPSSSAFLYIGYPGEPALGPATFMHRLSGIDNPEAPITHHWLDATHITFGVATAGYVWRNWKAEVSTFNGREPDQYRWNFDSPRFDSYSGRLTYNPSKNWSLQISQGFIKSPEQLEPDVNQNRTTASATYNQPLDTGNWQTTLAWGLNNTLPGRASHALLLESELSWHERHTVFGRAEWVQKDELFDAPDPMTGQQFEVGKFTAGYIYDVPVAAHVKVGLGGLASLYALPSSLDQTYGSAPVSFMLFARAKLD